jgi:MarR family transcriptional regulator, 2-MHQ and catechol-resistance regulon repressor
MGLEMVEDPLCIYVFSALLKSASMAGSRVYKKLPAGDLTPRQFAVLEVLCREGPISINELAGEIALSAEAAGKVIAALEKRNLVARRRDDRNKSMIALTTEGGRLINALFPAHQQLVEQVMGRLTRAEQENLRRLCSRFLPSEKGL